jgi:hypothetical protein
MLYGMIDVGRGVTKHRRTIYLIHTLQYRLCGARSGSPQLYVWLSYTEHMSALLMIWDPTTNVIVFPAIRNIVIHVL